MRHPLILTTLLSVVACDSPAAPTYRLNQDFTLAPGKSVVITGPNVHIRFVGVEGDSRCPADALCIQGGDAVVRIEARSPQSQARSHELHTGNMQPVVYDGLTIALVRLEPYPFSSRTIAPHEYRATLLVAN